MFWSNRKKDTDLTPDSIPISQIEVISNLVKDVTTSLSLGTVLQISADAVVDELKLHGCILFLKGRDGQFIYTKTISESKQSRIALRMLNADSFLNKLKVNLSVKNNLVVDTVLNRHINTSLELWRFTVGVLDKNLVDLIQRLTFTGNSIAIPIIYEDNCLGALLFTKRNRNADFEREMPLLKIYSSQVGIAIKNAEAYTLIEENVKLLARKNTDLQSLFNLTSRINETLDPKKVAQTAVDSLPQDTIMIGAVLTKYDEKENTLSPLAVTYNQIAEKAMQILGDFTKYKVNLNNPEFENNPVTRVAKFQTIESTQDLFKIFCPPVPKIIMPTLQKLLNVKGCVVFPVIVKNKLAGTITYLLKEKSFEELDVNEKQLLSTFTYQIAIALDNATLYQNEEKIRSELEIVVNELKQAHQHEQDMIDIMGHELRTPMSIVRNALVMMDLHLKNEKNVNPEKIRKFLDMGLESARREVLLIETLLSATKADSKGFQLILQEVDLIDVVGDSISGLVSEATKKGLEVRFNKPSEKISVFADRTRTQEIMDNFLSNAIKYTSKGFIEIIVDKDSESGFVSITDTGEGISKEDLQKIGTKFFRAQQYTPVQKNGDDADVNIIRPGGTGLGLYVTFSLVQIMDGKISVTSELGNGTTFKFTLPIFKGQELKQVEKKVDLVSEPVKI